MSDRSKHGSLGSDNDPQFQIVSDEQALRAGEATYTKPGDADPPSPTPSDGRGDQ
jgi:hypothetical protein